MKRKMFSMVLVSMMSISLLAGCSSGSDSTSTSDADRNDGLRIAIITSPSGIDDGNFNENNYNGILAFIEGSPNSTVNAIQETTGDVTACIQAVSDIVADYDVIVTPGFQFAGISSIAIDNPDKKFILIDSTPAEIDGVSEFDNIYSMLFADEESGFFAGIAAALETETNKVACVNGIAYPSNVNYQYGFQSGVNYANEIWDLDVELIELPSYAGVDVTNTNVGGNYIGDFADEATGKVVGNALINEGVDIMLVAAGGSGNGVFTAAKEAGNVMVIGCDVDQFDDGRNGDQNIVLTSAIKVMDANVERVLYDVQNGTFEGGNVTLGADTNSTGYTNEDGRHQLSDDTISKLTETYALLQSGDIVPAANFNGFTPDSFIGLPSYN